MGSSTFTGHAVTHRYDLCHSNSAATVQMIRSRLLGDKLPFTPRFTLVTILWLFQCQEGNVAGQQSVPFTAALVQTSENALATAEGPDVAQLGKPPRRLQSAPPTTPENDLLQFQEVVSSLQFHNYSIGARYLSDNIFLLPLDSTLFVPTNAAFDELSPSPHDLGPVLAYHTILQQLSYQQVTLLPVGSRLMTMIINNTIVVTSAAPDDFRVDNVQIVEGNVCSSPTVALQTTCHGVDGILNMTEWGTAILAHFAPVPSPTSDAPVSEVTPPTMPPTALTPVPAGEMASSGDADAVQRQHAEFLVLFLYVFAATCFQT